MFGTSYPKFKLEVRDYLFRLLPRGSTVLDVGAGDGVYGKLLHERFTLIAVEIFENAVKHLRESGYYEAVVKHDIRYAHFVQHFDLAILGDIIEHMTVTEAQEVIKQCEEHSDYVLIAVPYMYEQGALYGNQAEVHMQPDLTPAIFDERYKGYTRLFGDANYGYYIKSKYSEHIENYD